MNLCACCLFINTCIICKCHNKCIINWTLIGPSLSAGARKGLHCSLLRITKNICRCRDPSPRVCEHNVTAPAATRPQPQHTTIGQTGAGGAAGLGSTRYSLQAGCGRIPRVWSLVTGQAAVLQCLSPENTPPTAVHCSAVSVLATALAEVKLRLWCVETWWERWDLRRPAPSFLPPFPGRLSTPFPPPAEACL